MIFELGPAEPAPLRVVGLDSAADRWHVCTVGVVGLEYAYCPKLTYGNKATEHYRNPDVRRAKLVSSFYEFVVQLPDDTHLFAEEPIMGKNGQTTRLLSLAAGALWATAAHNPLTRVWWHWVPVPSWKQTFTGNGNASKELVKETVAKHLKPVPPEWETQEDLFDAYGLLFHGCHVLREAAARAKSE